MNHKIILGLYGVIAGANGFYAVKNLLEYFNAKAAVVQAYLEKSPEVNRQVYRYAIELANRVVPAGKLFLGLFDASVAGLLAGYAIIDLSKKNLSRAVEEKLELRV